MKTKLTLLLAVVLPLAAHAAEDLSTALQKGLFEEEANQNLPAAIKAYESLLAANDAQRKLAATALFRLGECYRKLGQTNDAVVQYQRLIRDYADQGTLATLSRQNLTGLGVPMESPRAKGMMGVTVPELLQLYAAQNATGGQASPSPAQVEAQRLLIERLELEIKTAEAEVANYKKMIEVGTVPQNSADKVQARLLDLRRQLVMARDSGTGSATASSEATQAEELVKQLQALSGSELRRVLPTVAPDPLLNSLLERLADFERSLAQKQRLLADDHPDIKGWKDSIAVVQQQIDERIDGIMRGLSIKAATLKQQSSGGGLRVGEPAPTDEEEKEIRRIQALIKDSPDLINAVNVEVTRIRSGELMVPRNGTLLHKAASLGQLQVAKHLLEHGANPGVRDDMSRLPLHWAAENGHKAMVELLLANKADVNAKISGWSDVDLTPLHLAVKKGFRSVCEILLAGGADPNPVDWSGATPIYYALSPGNEAILRLLVAKGAKVNLAPGKKGNTPLHNAESTNIVQVLIDNGAVVDALNNFDQTPLHGFAMAGKADVVELLLGAGANPRLKDREGMTPLHLAARAWKARVIAPLIAKGANPNERNAHGAVPLDAVIPFGSGQNRDVNRTPQVETLQALLAGGADPNLVTAGYAAQLYRAVAEGLEEAAEVLLRAGANPNAKAPFQAGSSLKGWTALIQALVRNGRSISLVNLLLENKADPSLPGGDGNPPLYFAIAYGGQSFADKAPYVEALLNKGADIEGRNENGSTPLAFSVEFKMKEMTELLLKHKADPNAKTGDGRSPLHLAVANRSSDLTDLLLAAGADPNATDAQGLSALDYLKPTGLGSRPDGLRGLPPPSPIPNLPGQPSSQRREVSQSELADRLRKAGARDWAPRPGLITVTRRSTGASVVAFTKGTNDWNRHSLLELVGFTYFGSGTGFPFPDFSKVTITRLDPAKGGVREFTIDLPAVLAKDGCKADQWLEWGDLIDIPEGEHKLDERWEGMLSVDVGAVAKCLARSVTIIVKGKSKEVPLIVGSWRTEHGGAGVIRYYPERLFRLRNIVLESGLLLTSSDTARVKVTRSDAVNGFKEWTFDLSKEPSAGNDLWLRDGDVIEVPEK